MVQSLAQQFAPFVLGRASTRPEGLQTLGVGKEWDPMAPAFVGVALQAHLTATISNGQSLGPGQRVAPDFVRLCSEQLHGLANRQRRCLAARGLAALLLTMVDSFPNNIFWDCDVLLAEGLRHEPGPERLNHYFVQNCRLLRDYGRHGGICFQYAHDFLYGFDWSKWRLRDASGRAGARPFGPEFRAHLARRAVELRRAIAADDELYPQLPGDRFRNPFSFARAPQDESRLLLTLSGAGELPVAAWLAQPRLAPERDFAALRRARAAELGIAGRPRGDGRQALS